MSLFTAIGLMSGASLDGVDAAVVRTDGEGVIEAGPARRLPYTRALKVLLRRAAKAAREGRDGAADIADAEAATTRVHAAAATALMAEAGLKPDAVDVVGFHGHTILHRAAARSPDGRARVWQIGDGAKLAEEIGAPVVNRFRDADIAAGGEGAPFTPAYYAALARAHAEREAIDGPLAVLELGAAARLVYASRSVRNIDLAAFDCGPGEALIQAWMGLKTGDAIDRDGIAAKSGRIRSDRLKQMLMHDYLRRPGPKRLDPEDFTLDAVADLSLTDGAATLTAFSAACVRLSVDLTPAPPAAWIVAGLGQRNPALVEALSKALPAPLTTAEQCGWPGEESDAACFGYLAVRALKKLPLSYPKTTGAARPTPGGVVHAPPKEAAASGGLRLKPIA